MPKASVLHTRKSITSGYRQEQQAHTRSMLTEILLILFGLLFVLTLWLGFQQTPPDQEQRQGYATAAVILFIAQAIITLFSLAWTGLFVLGAAWLALCLLCHHAVIHRNSRFDGQTCACSCFQLKDIMNHETWIVAALTAGLISVLRV